MLQVQVKLKMEQPKCRARVEFHPRPERERLLHFETALEALKIIRETVKTAVKLKKENSGSRRNKSLRERLTKNSQENTKGIFRP
jgi:hypothetical protein